MELPNLGQHCSEALCRRLDFLPVKCNGCSKVFCGEHYSYDGHNCPEAYKRNVQVPVCPLCNALIPGKASELPDIRVSRHIESDCVSDTAVSRRSQKVYNNRCSVKGCKQKELVPVRCDRCSVNYCLKHRHPEDHSCTNATGKPVTKSGLAALARISQTSSGRAPTTSRTATAPSIRTDSSRTFLSGLTSQSGNNTSSSRNVSTLQGNISEEDALRMAIEASMSPQESGPTPSNTSPTDALSQEQEDFFLAKALAESEMDLSNRNQSSSGRRQQQNCDIC